MSLVVTCPSLAAIQQSLPKYPKYYNVVEVKQLFSKIIHNVRLFWDSFVADLSDDFIWIFLNYDLLDLPCHHEKIFDGILYNNWLDYYQHHSSVRSVCLHINGIYHIVELYDNEWYAVPMRYNIGLGPTNIKDALFLKLFCPDWPTKSFESTNKSIEYHPKTTMLINSSELDNLLSNESWEFIHDIATLNEINITDLPQLSELIKNYKILTERFAPIKMMQFIENYEILIKNFAKFWFVLGGRDEVNSQWLSDDWVCILERKYLKKKYNHYVHLLFDPIDGNFVKI